MTRRSRVPSAPYERIRAVVAAIPAGRVATYGQVAALAGLPGHARQVGYALRSLPDDSPVPWQRVINARGEVSRRAGEDLVGPSQGFQRHLLEEEDIVFDLGGSIDLERYGWQPGERSRATRQGQRFSVRSEVAALDARLLALGSPERAAGEKRYLKSSLEFRGVDVPTLRREARLWSRAHSEAGRRQLLALARTLWRRDVHELRSLAVEILRLRVAALLSEDVEVLEWMLRRAGTWAHVDAIAPDLVGGLLARDAKLLRRLDGWVRGDDFWLQRAALLALLPSLRRENRHWARFSRYADALLEDRQFFLRKAIGWVLREVSKRDPSLVEEFVGKRLGRLSGVTLREAVRRLPERSRRRVLAADRRARRPARARKKVAAAQETRRR